MPTATTTPRVAQQSRHSPPTTPGTTVAQAMDKKPLMHKAQTRHVEHNDAPAARRATSMTWSVPLYALNPAALFLSRAAAGPTVRPVPIAHQSVIHPFPRFSARYLTPPPAFSNLHPRDFDDAPRP